MTLNSLGRCFSDLGRREEALKTTGEAVAIYRELAAERPDAFLPDLSSALNNLGNHYSKLGRRDEALEATEEAVSIYRELAAEHPDAFLPDLSSALNNLGIRYSNLGRRKEALKATEEAVAIYRELAAERPDAFLPDLARSLGTLGLILQDGDPAAARDAFHEGCTMVLPFCLKLPKAFIDLTDFLIKQYISACDSADTPPDPELMEQYQPILEMMKGKDDGND